MLRDTIRLQRRDHLRADQDGIDAEMRPCRMPAKPGDIDVEFIGRGHDGAGANGEGADRNARAVVHAIDLFDAETVHQPVLDHRGGAGPTLLGRLEDHHRIAGEIARLGEIAGSAQQHRGVAVMAAGVHLAGGLGGIGQIGRLLDRQRIHVGAQPDHLQFALAGGLLALDDADDAGKAETCRHLVAAEFPQAVRHECCGAVYIVKQFGMFMDIAAPGLDVGLKIGDAIDDGHENSLLCGLNAAASVACKARSTQPSAAGRLSAAGASRSGLESHLTARPHAASVFSTSLIQ